MALLMLITSYDFIVCLDDLVPEVLQKYLYKFGYELYCRFVVKEINAENHKNCDVFRCSYTLQ
jgi:hypothetical protein